MANKEKTKLYKKDSNVVFFIIKPLKKLDKSKCDSWQEVKKNTSKIVDSFIGSTILKKSFKGEKNNKNKKLNCEFFVTRKKFARKQYVNSFGVITKMLEKKEKFGYSIYRYG